MKEGLVSIIMPAWNCEATIIKSINSALAQSYQNFELLICDDGSTDKTREIIKKLAINDSRIHIIDNVYTKGAPGARNSALNQAQGEFIAFLDSDDIWFENKLSKQLSEMKNKKLDFCYSYYSLMSNHKLIKAPKAINLNLLRIYNPIGCLTAMYDIKSIGKVYQPNIISRNDYALWLILFNKKIKSGCVNENLAIYNDLTNGISSNLRRNLFYYYKALVSYSNLNFILAIFCTLTFLAMNFFKKYNLNFYNIIQEKL